MPDAAPHPEGIAIIGLAGRFPGNDVLDELPDVRGGKVLDGPLPDQGNDVAIDPALVSIKGRGPLGLAPPGKD